MNKVQHILWGKNQDRYAKRAKWLLITIPVPSLVASKILNVFYGNTHNAIFLWLTLLALLAFFLGLSAVIVLVIISSRRMARRQSREQGSKL